MKSWIALIRAIGPATHKKMTMAQLRAACDEQDFQNVRTYIASGNLLFSSGMRKAEVHSVLTGILSQYGLDNEVFLRTPEDMELVIAKNPLTDASIDRPNHLLVTFLANKHSAQKAKAFDQYDGPERIYATGRELYIDYKDGVARSKLTPKKIENIIGQPGTARNWNTINKLLALSRE